MTCPSDMTAPPAGALEACLALLEKATPGEWESHTTNITMVGLDLADPMKACGLLVASGSPDQAKNNADFVAAAVNLLKDHGPALLAALRLREGCAGLENNWREVAKADDRTAREQNNNQWFRGSANANRICADDLARVLEEG